MMYLCRAIALIGLLVLPATAAAQVIYDGGPPDGGAGLDLWGDNLVADDFEVASGSLFGFDAVRFWGLSSDLLSTGATTDAFWKFFLDDGAGAPGAAVAEGTSSASFTGLGGGSWQLDFFVGALALGEGTYWLALNTPLMGDLIWQTSSGGRGDSFGNSYTWDQTTWGAWDGAGDLAFELRSTTVTPEPVTMILLGSGLAGIGAAARRRRTKKSDPV